MLGLRSFIAAGVLAAPILVPAKAAAQPAGHDVATAQALFDEGKRLMQGGNYDEGCPKLVESQRIDPAGGTLLIIALCHEGQGKIATAWAEFGVALGEARKDRRADREAAAREHIRVLEPKLVRARIVVTAKVEGFEVRRDGTNVGEAQWGSALPIDPGEHAFEASAPGKTPWTTTVRTVGEGATIDVTVPALEDDPNAASRALPPAAVTPREAPPLAAAEGASGAGSRLPWIAVAGGIGLVGVGVGILTGLSARSQWDDARHACPGGRCPDPADIELGQAAGTRADISTASFVIGGVGLATAVLLYLTVPSENKRSSLRRAIDVTPLAGAHGGSLVLRGAL